jgi:EAL domain-containing protein (putative c-di-GMP-specific phosphodiesterase class I)
VTAQLLGIPPAPADLGDPAWGEALRAVLADEATPTLHAQPIVELTSGSVAGYEMLARFAGPLRAAPDRWFAAADRWGCGAAQARVVRRALAARAMLPPDTFLTVNVDPHWLTSPEVRRALCGHAAAGAAAGDELARIIVELTEHTEAVDKAALAEALVTLRARGALIAVDDAGTGYAGLAQLLEVRPQLVKVDRELVTGIDADPVKQALVEVLGDFAGRMDAWLLAEGIETEAELDALVRLGVALGQGFLLGRPAATMAATIAPELVERIRRFAARAALGEHIASLIQQASVGGAPDAVGSSVDVVLDPHGRSTLVRHLDGYAPALVVAPSASPAETARRAMARAREHRFAPVVCTDGRGELLGIVPVESLVGVLARTGPHSDH